MSRVTMTWYGGQVTRSLERELGKRVQQTARMLANKVIDNISTEGPPASSPGDYPHKASGSLVSSVDVIYTSSTSASVVVSAEHAKFVEKARPFFLRTQKEMKRKLIAFMSRPLSK